MSVNYNAAVKTARMNAVVAAIDVATPGTLEICNAAYALVLAAIPLSKPSFTVAGAVMTMAGVPKSDTAADNTGTAAIARIKDGNGVVVVDGLTVGTAGTDITLNSVTITAGQTVTITAGTITHS